MLVYLIINRYLFNLQQLIQILAILTLKHLSFPSPFKFLFFNYLFLSCLRNLYPYFCVPIYLFIQYMPNSVSSEFPVLATFYRIALINNLTCIPVLTKIENTLLLSIHILLFQIKYKIFFQFCKLSNSLNNTNLIVFIDVI